MDRLRRIVIDEDGDVFFYFKDSDEPFVPWEFSKESPTRKYLIDIQNAIKAETPAVQETIF